MHLIASSDVSTTIPSKAGQAVVMAHSNLPSIAPKSPNLPQIYIIPA